MSMLLIGSCTHDVLKKFCVSFRKMRSNVMFVVLLSSTVVAFVVFPPIVTFVSVVFAAVFAVVFSIVVLVDVAFATAVFAILVFVLAL